MKLKRNNNIIIGKWTMSKKEAELMAKFKRQKEELFINTHRTIMDYYKMSRSINPR